MSETLSLLRPMVPMESECLTVISLPYRTQYGSIIKNEIPRNAHSYSIKKSCRLVEEYLDYPDSLGMG